mgnify:CR=1 FL=1
MIAETTLQPTHQAIDSLSLLKQALEHRQNLLIILGNQCEIFVNGTRRSFFTRGHDYRQATLIDYRACSVIPASAAPQYLTEERPVSELLWTVAYHQSNGALLGQCRRDDVVQLVRWPNFTRLPHELSDHRMAALLTRRATSLVLASRVLKTDEPELNRFYSAAHAAGYTRIVNRPASTVIERQEHKHQTIIGKLINRFWRK